MKSLLTLLMWSAIIAMLMAAISYGSNGSAIKLPAELRALQIKNLEIGQYGFCVPKAMVVDEYGDCYLLGWVELDKSNTGTGWLKVERKADGYYVSIRMEKAKWSRERIFNRADKLRDMDLIPVQKITISGHEQKK